MGRKSRSFGLATGFLTLGLFMAGCTAAAPVAGTPGALDHVVIIVEENKPSQAIIGNSDAPYINKLATDYALAGNYQAVAHPSLPNYLALTGGTNAGITDDCAPAPNARQTRRTSRTGSRNQAEAGKCTPRTCPLPVRRRIPASTR